MGSASVPDNYLSNGHTQESQSCLADKYPPPPPQKKKKKKKKKNSKQTKAYFFVINLSETLRVIADQRLHRLQKAVFVKIDINNNFQRQRLKKQQRTSLVETRTRCSV